MPPKIITKKNSEKIAGELRRSQMLTVYGNGALVDFPRLSGIMAGLDAWKVTDGHLPPSAKIHERNLELLLGKSFFYQVSTPEGELGDTFSLPAYRFPSWYYCPTCHRLDRYKIISESTSGNTSKFNRELACNKCSTSKKKVKLIPSRFVAACVNGHIEDFPYEWWCHRHKGMCADPRLKIEYKGTTGGLDGIHISCETCEAEETMEGCMRKDALKGYRCSGNMPWLGFDDRHWHKDPNPCSATLRCLQRTANNVYYSVNQSALTIPPWSERLQRIFAEKNELFEDIFDDDEDETARRLKKQFNKDPEFYGGNLDAFLRAAYARYRDEPETITPESLRSDEYIAFCSKDNDDEYFRTEAITVPEVMKPYFSSIKQVKRLREVMVLQGFRRILPQRSFSEEERKELGLSNEFSPLSKEPKNWLPAIELFGEGIFFELNEEKVAHWENEFRSRYEKMFEAHKKCEWIGNGMFNSNSPRFVLLHTLSHLLIRQLTAQCGYSAASIKEKIYSSYPTQKGSMCGILIYTSATDTDGSLGGLVREGESDRIKDTFLNMLQESSWCSNDPLCGESTSQGYEGLNYSACHACTLLPETSCEAYNCLLDRGAIVGTPEHKEIAFFKELL